MRTIKLYFDRYKQLLPALVLAIYSILAVMTAIQGTVVIAGESYDYSLTIRHYLAFAAVILNVVGFFTFRRFYKYVLLTTIVLGIFNYITFSALETTRSFNIGGLRFGFQPSAFFAGLVAYIANRKKVNKLIIDLFRSSPDYEEKNAKVYWSESVNKFKEQYKNYSSEELDEILTEKKYVAEALEAARQLRSERNQPAIGNQTNK